MRVENQQQNHENFHLIFKFMSFVVYQEYRRVRYLQNRCSMNTLNFKKRNQTSILNSNGRQEMYILYIYAFFILTYRPIDKIFVT